MKVKPTLHRTIMAIKKINVTCQYCSTPDISSLSAISRQINPPSLKPVHHPTTAIAAPAAMLEVSSFFICSILRASIVIS